MTKRSVLGALVMTIGLLLSGCADSSASPGPSPGPICGIWIQDGASGDGNASAAEAIEPYVEPGETVTFVERSPDYVEVDLRREDDTVAGHVSAFRKRSGGWFVDSVERCREEG